MWAKHVLQEFQLKGEPFVGMSTYLIIGPSIDLVDQNSDSWISAQ